MGAQRDWYRQRLRNRWHQEVGRGHHRRVYMPGSTTVIPKSQLTRSTHVANQIHPLSDDDTVFLSNFSISCKFQSPCIFLLFYFFIRPIFVYIRAPLFMNFFVVLFLYPAHFRVYSCTSFYECFFFLCAVNFHVYK